MTKCKKCGKAIVFIQSEKTKKFMPCDEGLVEYRAGKGSDYEDWVVNDKGEMVRCTFDFTGDPDGLARIPHWATCPFANEFRKR